MRKSIKDIELNVAYCWSLVHDFSQSTLAFLHIWQEIRMLSDTNLFESIFMHILGLAEQLKKPALSKVLDI
ncbi:hypothetical protein DUZ99_14785 [Xylanibacillus composti]|uniref:Uncharacterized protein n=1 Tax=Xylanibacillus composti TaxID=1572762 RepID=A0A8J4H290_9BACL|nr:hypothetical protein [Xylanibacillus composti]GIQ68096.1 hypothetical protein XYCOK13_09200 [Xylanibacillus composti]